MKNLPMCHTKRHASTRAALFSLSIASILFPATLQVLADPASSSQMLDTKKQRVTRLREQRELQAIYDAMSAAQRRGDTKVMLKYFATDVKIVVQNGAQLTLNDLRKQLRTQTKTRHQEKSKSSIRSFARRGAFADVKVFTHAEVTMFAPSNASTRSAKPQQLVVESLRRETWRKTPPGWRLVFSRVLVHTIRAK